MKVKIYKLWRFLFPFKVGDIVRNKKEKSLFIIVSPQEFLSSVCPDCTITLEENIHAPYMKGFYFDGFRVNNLLIFKMILSDSEKGIYNKKTSVTFQSHNSYNYSYARS